MQLVHRYRHHSVKHFAYFCDGLRIGKILEITLQNHDYRPTDVPQISRKSSCQMKSIKRWNLPNEHWKVLNTSVELRGIIVTHTFSSQLRLLCWGTDRSRRFRWWLLGFYRSSSSCSRPFLFWRHSVAHSSVLQMKSGFTSWRSCQSNVWSVKRRARTSFKKRKNRTE